MLAKFLGKFMVKSADAEFVGESNEKRFRFSDVAEAIRVLIRDDFIYELRTALASFNPGGVTSSNGLRGTKPRRYRPKSCRVLPTWRDRRSLIRTASTDRWTGRREILSADRCCIDPSARP